jgi:hypothetical protein
MATLDEIATQLLADGVGTFGTDLFAHRLPAEPVQAVAMIEYGGRVSEHAYGDVRVKWEWPRVQFACRGPVMDAAAARAKANAVRNSVAKMANQTVGGTKYLQVAMLQPPFLLKWDDNESPIFAFNVEFKREVPAGE